MSRRKLSRHEMKQDEFVSTVGRITLWAEEHLAQIALAAGGIVVLGLLAFGLISWREARLLRAEAAMAEVTEAYAAAVGENAAAGAESFPTREAKYQAVRERAESVIERYGSSPAGERARYYRGLALYESGDLPGARAALEEFVRRNEVHFLAPHARRKIAACHRREGDLARACATYRDLVDVEVAEFPTELALIDLGTCLADSGEHAEAIRTLQRVVDEYPDSAYVAQAREELSRLEGTG